METEQSNVLRNAQASSGVNSDAVAGNENNEEVKNKFDSSNSRDVELQRLIDELRARVDNHWNDLLRARADLENVRRRAERDVENAHKFALERFANELLPVKDSLELGLTANTVDINKLHEGIELTLRMLTNAMNKFGIREINPINEKFNPELHQAMSVQPSAAHPANTVLNVYQKGYTLNDRLIRPALVIVSQFSENNGKSEA